MPAVESFSLTSGKARMRMTSALSLLTISGGVLAGASPPCQSGTTKPGRPDSATVGISGTAAERLAELTASARKRPLVANGNDDGMLANENDNCPPIKSVIAGPPPLYGTCTASTFAMI